MAEQVTGRIGDNDVELNNAATEATLKSLLAIAKIDSQNLVKLALAAGVKETELKKFQDEIKKSQTAVTNNASALNNNADALKTLDAEIKKTDQELKELQNTTTKVKAVFVGLDTAGQKLIAGTAQTSDLLSTFGKSISVFNEIPGIVGKLAISTGIFVDILSRAASFQEANLKAYQMMTNAGANFSGSLTDLRQAAAGTYLTLDQFGNLIKSNSELFSRMGGSVNDGAVAFAKFSHNMLSGDVGMQIASMGYTMEGANQSMATFIGLMGVKDTKELATSKVLQESTLGYLDQLDRLAEITGKGREEQEKQLKQAMFEADVQMTMSRMSKEDQMAFTAAMNEAGTLYGQAGRDIVLAQAQGRAVTGEAGKMMMATAGQAGQTVSNLQAIAKQYGADSAQFRAASAKSQREAGDALARIPLAAFSTNDSLKKMNDVTITAAKNRMAGMVTDEDFAKRDKKRQDELDKRHESQAAEMAKLNQGVNELGQSLLGLITPIVKDITPIFMRLGEMASGMAKWMGELSDHTKRLIGAFSLAVVGIGAYVLATKALELVEKQKSLAKLREEMIGRGSSPANPMWVQESSGGLGGKGGGLGGDLGSIAGEAEKDLAAAGKTSKFSKALSTAGKAARSFAKMGGVLSAVTSAYGLYSDLSDISEKQKAGAITKEEVTKEKGGAVGEAGGGFAGGVAGAAAGAAIGSLLVPVVGTVIGGLIGGALGTFGGGSLGKSLGEWAGTFISTKTSKKRHFGHIRSISAYDGSGWYCK